MRQLSKGMGANIDSQMKKEKIELLNKIRGMDSKVDQQGLSEDEWRIIYTYIRMTHYKLFSVILLTYKMSTSSTNYQLLHHPPNDKSPLHHAT
jgi:hypothetical protein